MKAFVINLDHATERWENIRQEGTEIGLDVHRIPAVFGDDLAEPYQDYSQPEYRKLHGKRTNVREIGCYQSHLRAMESFLDTGDEYGIILEDDVRLHAKTLEWVDQATRSRQSWDLLRLSGLHSGTPAAVESLGEGASLAVNLSRQTGAGAYVVNQKAATLLCVGLLPMKLPYDHAFDREWVYGFDALSLVPYPVQQNERYASSIEHTAKYGPSRYLTVFPYRAVNETRRVAHRSFQYLSSRMGVHGVA